MHRWPREISQSASCRLRLGGMLTGVSFVVIWTSGSISSNLCVPVWLQEICCKYSTVQCLRCQPSVWFGYFTESGDTNCSSITEFVNQLRQLMLSWVTACKTFYLSWWWYVCRYYYIIGIELFLNYFFQQMSSSAYTLIVVCGITAYSNWLQEICCNLKLK